MSEGPLSAADAFELFLEQRRRGEPVDAAEFAARYPELEAELAVALDGLLALEEASRLARAEDGSLPRSVGPYQVLRELGRGGMGVVLEAIEEPLGRRVALKVLPPELLASAVARARFRREAQIASRLDHSGIATIYGAGVEADQPWIAMRFVEGETLARAIALARDAGARCVQPIPAGADERGSPRWIAATLARVARALQFAHEQGVVHRDVKPSNIIVAADGAPVLLDFGLAIGDEPEAATLTRTGQTAGTPAYLAPELVSGERSRPDAQSDVYALGVTLYECLTLRRPFEGATPVALYRAIVSGTASDVRSSNADVPRDLAVVVATAMEREPARRYRTAAALAADLEACAAGRPILARPVPLHGRVLRWARREPRQALLVGLLATTVVALAVFAGTWWSSRDTVRAAELAEADRRYEQLLQEGFASLATRHPGDAEASFRAALALQSSSVEARIGSAMVAFDRRQHDAVAALLEGVPASPALDALRALVAGRTPPRELPAEWLANASAIELFVDGMRLMRQAELGPRYEREAIYVLAAARFGEAVQRSPTARAVFQAQRALASRNAKDERGVRSAAAALVKLWPQSPRALFTAGNALLRYDARAGRELLERAIQLDPTWGPPHQLLGNAHFYAKRFAEAVAEQQEAIRLDPGDADAWNSLGLAWEELGCHADARGAHLRAVSLRPGMFEAWGNLASVEYSQKEYAACAAAERVAIGLAPLEPITRAMLGHALERLKRWDESRTHVEIALGLDPKDGTDWQVLAVDEINLGEPELGLLAIEGALEVQPGNAGHLKLRDIALQHIAEKKAAEAAAPATDR